MPRRKAGELLPIELRILEAGLRLAPASFHGFALAAEISPGESHGHVLTAHGTLYKALGRLATAGLLVGEWEDATAAEAAGRPRRKLYSVTSDGAIAVAKARAASAAEPGHGAIAARRLA